MYRKTSQISCCSNKKYVINPCHKLCKEVNDEAAEVHDTKHSVSIELDFPAVVLFFPGDISNGMWKAEKAGGGAGWMDVTLDPEGRYPHRYGSSGQC